MAKTSDSPERRLDRFFAGNKRRSNKLDEVDNKLLELLEEVISENKEKEAEKEYDGSTTVGEFHDAIRAMMRKSLIADYVLTLNLDNELDKPLAAAFAAAGLDYKNPLHWKLLLREFAIAHFVPKRGGGAPIKWTADRYCRLLAQVHQLKLNNAHLTDRGACTIICKWPEYQQKSEKRLSVERLRKALREARNPDINDILSRSLEQNLIHARVRCQQENRSWTPGIAAELRKKLIADLTNWIAKNWLKRNGNKK
jgi:hypothetical protein